MHPEEALARIRREIKEQGRLTFARFMELALFSPRGGYYTRAGNPTRDYYTSPEVHPLFGALICRQLFQMWDLLGRPRPFTVAEVGAGRGLLARAVVGYARQAFPTFARALLYLVLDRALPQGAPAGAVPVRASGLPLRPFVGCVLSNELLDSLPVHRFRVVGGRVLEVYVALEGDRLVEVVGTPSTPLLEEWLRRLGLPLEEGHQGEVCLALEGWVRQVAEALERGFVLTVDYGGLAEEVYPPARPRGTLRCFYRHALAPSPYERVGQQDITASVDFSTLMALGEAQGLEVLGYTTQASFLRALGHRAFVEALERMRLPPAEYHANRMGMQELVRPGGLGDFRVLVQGKGVGRPPLWGLGDSPAPLPEAQGRPLSVPLMGPEHARLAGSRYPHLEFDPEELWR